MQPNFPNQRDRMIRPSDTTTRNAMSDKKTKSKTRKPAAEPAGDQASAPHPETDPAAKPAKDLAALADKHKKVRYRLTADFKKENGVVLKKGTAIDATADEVRRRQIPAEPV
jgi:hypothetical protein